jgi:truncated hemoglobin YjbI
MSMSNAIVASFTGRVQADAALRSLHAEGFRRTWLAVVETVDANAFGGAGGTVGAGRETVHEVQGGNPLTRFFRRDSNRTLYDALRDRGVDDDAAMRIDGTIVEGNCVLVVEGANDPRCAEELVAQAGGEVLAAPEPLSTEPGPLSDDPMAVPRMIAAERDALRERRMSIVPVVSEDVFVERRSPVERS